MFSREPYSGSSRKLVLAFDVGTTFSGVSYCILDPSEIPKIHGVSKYPEQESTGGDSRIPSILHYDKEGLLRAVGAETQQKHIIELAASEQWTRLEWWKLYLRAKSLEAAHFTDADIPPLPKGKTAVQVLGDFMSYLFKCSKAYITEVHTCLWESLESNIEFVLTHPNGWEGPQQQQIRQAAVQGGLVPAGEEGQLRIHLLTEGEASLHFCVTNMLTSDVFNATPILCSELDDQEEMEQESQPDRQGVIIIDAGGGTVDLSAYSMKLSPTSFKEIAPAECRLQGSVFITYRAHVFLRAKLANSRYGSEENLWNMSEIFDKTTKVRFRDVDEPQYIKFGGIRDKDPEYGIRSGQLKLIGEDVAKLFEPSVQEIIAAFEQQRAAASMPITSVFLVGGFAASDWLHAKLVEHMNALDVTFYRPCQHVNKAVADGAVSFFIDHLVSSRTARFTYGTECNASYNEHDSEHVARREHAFEGVTGFLELPHAFESILEKGTEVSEEQEFKKPFIIEEFDLSHCGSIHVDIVAYRGKVLNPSWVDTERDAFATLCSVHADTSKLAQSMQPHHLPDGGGTYYSIMFYVVLLFGLTELKAQISWYDNGMEIRSPASVVYEDTMFL
ncbi:hypothetical protein JVU11DRAFT_6994 [Chiua virens]|nr:hypothetical protein JVU11DRAFT_6994 [Chiua virens]